MLSGTSNRIFNDVRGQSFNPLLEWDIVMKVCFVVMGFGKKVEYETGRRAQALQFVQIAEQGHDRSLEMSVSASAAEV